MNWIKRLSHMKVRYQMQIVIDIPENIYETIKEEEVGNVVYKAIKNGTPLPIELESEEQG